MFSGLFDEDDYGDDRAPFPANRPGYGVSYSSGLSRKPPADKRSTHGFVGLLNQGATCYLNSLIQLMYMTPELKNNLYSLSLKDLDLEQLINDGSSTTTATANANANATIESNKIDTSVSINNSHLSSNNNSSSNTSVNVNVNVNSNDLISFMNEDMDDDIMKNVEWEEVGSTGVYPPRSSSSSHDIVDINSLLDGRNSTSNDIGNGSGNGGGLKDAKNLKDGGDIGDPFAKYDQDYVQSVLAFGFDESKVLEGLKKFPHVYQQERLINWILSDDVIDAHTYDNLPDLVPLGSFEDICDNNTQNNTVADDYAAFSTTGFADDNQAKFNSSNNNNNITNDSSKAIVLYDENNINNLLNGGNVNVESKSGNDSSMTPLLAAVDEQIQPKPQPQPQPQSHQPKKRRGRVLAYELQRLFSFLQVGQVRAIGTEDLTKSFGWYGNESSEQQDIHELNRILFDAFEHSIKLTTIEKLIIQLYRGVLINRIECTKCGKIKDRDEFYQDIPIPIQGFKKLEDSLKAYVTPEVLDGENKYSCDDCNEKVKANIGAKLGQLPPILVMPLRRFDYDYQRGSRVKITTQFEFPLELNMTPYTSDYSLHEKNPETVPKPDDQWYDLFAVLIHSGGAYGGHYHAYIKDITKQGVINVESPTTSTESQPQPEAVDTDSQPSSSTTAENKDTPNANNESTDNSTNNTTNGSKKSKKNKKDDGPLIYSGWFDFNDSTVTPIPDSQIAKQFGNKHESAYMLVYRSKELKTDKSSDIPSHLVDEMNLFNVNLEEQRLKYDVTMNTMFVNPRFFSEFDIVENSLVEKSNLQPSELSLPLEVSFSVQDLYSHVRKTYEDHIDHTSKLVIQEIIVKEGRVTLLPPLSSVSSTNIKKTGLREGCSLLIWRGAKAEGIQTPPINFSVDYYPQVSAEASRRQQFSLSIERDSTFTELLKMVANVCQLPVDKLAVYRSSANQLLLLEDDMPNIPLADRVYSGINLLVEDSSLKFDESALRQEFEMNKFKIQLYVSDRIDNIDNENDSFTNNKPITIHCDPKATIMQVKEIILDMVRPAEKSLLLRSTVVRKTQRGGSPGSTISDDSLTLKEVDITDSSLILIERGTPTQQTITIRFNCSKDGIMRTLYFPKKDNILDLKKAMLERIDVNPDDAAKYVLKTTDSFDLPLHIISEEDMTLEESGLRSEDLLHVSEGIIPSKDEIILKFALYQMKAEEYKQYPTPLSPILHLNPQYIPPAANLYTIEVIGDLSVNKKLTISELKAELLAWPKLAQNLAQFDPEQDGIRLWLEEKLLSGHGSGNKQLAKMHIQQEACIAIECYKKDTVPVVDPSSPPPILLYLHQRMPESQCFSCPPRQIYFTGKLISDLLTQVSTLVGVEEQNVKLFKYVTHQHMNPWRIIEERSQSSQNNNNKSSNNNAGTQLSINVHEDTTVTSEPTSTEPAPDALAPNSINDIAINAQDELPVDSVVEEPTNNISEAVAAPADGGVAAPAPGSIPPPPPPRPEKKKKPNTSNPNELRGKPWLLKDGDIIAFLDVRDDPELNDKFALFMEKSNYKSNFGANNFNKKQATTKYRAPERELKIQLDEY